MGVIQTGRLDDYCYMENLRPIGLCAFAGLLICSAGSVVGGAPEPAGQAIGRSRRDLSRLVTEPALASTGSQAVSLSQPWCLRGSSCPAELWPTNDLLTLRTVAGATLPGSVYLGPVVQCRWFAGGSGEATLTLWADDAAVEGRGLRRYLGGQPRQIDLTGRVRDLPLARRGRAEARFRLGLEDVGVNVLAQVGGSDIAIRQMVTNLSGQTLSFRGFVRGRVFRLRNG